MLTMLLAVVAKKRINSPLTSVRAKGNDGGGREFRMNLLGGRHLQKSVTPTEARCRDPTIYHNVSSHSTLRQQQEEEQTFPWA
jgi:hypothetical protein